MNTTLIIIQALTALVYVLHISYRFRGLPSISESWYRLKQKEKWKFTAFVFGLAIPLTIFSGYGVQFFLAGSFLAFVGVATMFKLSKTEEIVHNAGTVGGIIFSLLGLIANDIWFPTYVIAVGILGVFVNDIKGKVYWIEVISIVSILLGLLKLN
jgi:hypothetical protein